MAWYKQPVRPYDPVIEDDKESEASRYYRDTFDGTGQDSKTNPPGQDASMWELLFNIMPISAGGLDRRWGYTTLSQNISATKTRLASYQRDTDQLRTIVGMGSSIVDAFNEDGSTYTGSIFNPFLVPRMVNSRSYAYFFSGNANDLVKWNGNVTGGVSNWGIAFNTIIGNVTLGPNAPTVASGAWGVPNNALVSDGNYATVSTTLHVSDSPVLNLSGFGFSIPSNATILGIQVDVQGTVTSFDHVTTRQWIVALQKNGANIGNARAATMPVNAANAFYTTGGPTDLWGTSWLPNDLNGTTFHIAIQGHSINAPASIGAAFWNIDFARVTVTYLGALNAITVATGSAGLVNLTVGRIYYQVFANSSTGHLSDLGPASASTGPETNSQINLSTIPVSTDPQVDTKIILATSDGGDPSALYFVATIPNAQTTYVDNTPEGTLVLNQLYLFTDEFGNDFGVAENTPPPNGSICIKHKGRLWMAVGQNIYFSKSVSELTLPNGFIAGKYEEAWPQDTFLDISEGAENVTAMISSGQALFIGTERHVRWITGDDPSNFSEPEIVHAEVGVLNQEVWQSVFIQGTPSGCIWLTPDFRVILSDFNTYRDIGHPVQDVLNTINLAAEQTACAMFVDDGEFDLYILAIPTGTSTFLDTLLVFNMRSQMWVRWGIANNPTAMVFNVSGQGVPQWLFWSNANLYQFQPNVYTDAGTAIFSAARTSWLHLGAPTHRKLLDELEVVGDPTMLVSVEGATPAQDFNGADVHVYKSSVPLVVSPFGQNKVYLASSGAKDRYYRLTFDCTNANQEFLRSYNLKSLPFNTL